VTTVVADLRLRARARPAAFVLTADDARSLVDEIRDFGMPIPDEAGDICTFEARLLAGDVSFMGISIRVSAG
jgi:hypothetical protein